MKISPICCAAYTQNNVSKLSQRKASNVSQNQNLQQNVNFEGNKVKTATAAITGFTGAVIGFMVAGPIGAAVGGALGSGAGYTMESEDGKGSTGDNNFFDNRD